jgi:hypothetical protein
MERRLLARRRRNRRAGVREAGWRSRSGPAGWDRAGPDEWAELTEGGCAAGVAARAQQPDLEAFVADYRTAGFRQAAGELRVAVGPRRVAHRCRPPLQGGSDMRALAAGQDGGGVAFSSARRAAGQAVDGLAAIGVGSVLAALALGLLTTVASAARWCLVARGLGLRLPLAAAVSDCYRAVFLNSVLPAGVLGDVHRAVGYGRRIGDMGRGVRVVALERCHGPARDRRRRAGVPRRPADPAGGAAPGPARRRRAARRPRRARRGGAVGGPRRAPPGFALHCGRGLRRRAVRGPVPVDVAGLLALSVITLAATSRCSSSPPGSRGRRRRSPICCRCSCSACSRWRCRSTSAGGVRARGDGRGVRRGRPRRGAGSRPPSCTGC